MSVLPHGSQRGEHDVGPGRASLLHEHEGRDGYEPKVRLRSRMAFLIATIAQMVGVVLVSPILSAPDYLTEIAANEGRVLWGALLQSIGAIA